MRKPRARLQKSHFATFRHLFRLWPICLKMFGFGTNKVKIPTLFAAWGLNLTGGPEETAVYPCILYYAGWGHSLPSADRKEVVIKHKNTSPKLGNPTKRIFALTFALLTRIYTL